MKKRISVILLVAVLLSHMVAYGGAGAIKPKINGFTYALELLNYHDGLEELTDEISSITRLEIYPKQIEKYEELCQKRAQIHEKEPDGVELGFFDGVNTFPTQYPEVVVFPSVSDKYRAEASYNYSVPVIHACLKYLDNPEQDDIKCIILDNGIISAEIAALNDFPNLTSVVIPESVGQIIASGSNKYYEKEYRRDYREYAQRLGITEKELLNTPYQYSDGYISNQPDPKYIETIDQWNREQHKAEDDKCALASNNKITYYVKEKSYAESYLKTLGLKVENYVDVKYNNEEIFSDQPAVVINGRTLVPLRAIFEVMEATVEWDSNTSTVTATRNGTKISLQIDSDQLYINGKATTIDVPAKLINGRTMVPARAVAEAFNCKVDWDAESKTVLIK